MTSTNALSGIVPCEPNDVRQLWGRLEEQKSQERET